MRIFFSRFHWIAIQNRKCENTVQQSGVLGYSWKVLLFEKSPFSCLPFLLPRPRAMWATKQIQLLDFYMCTLYIYDILYRYCRWLQPINYKGRYNLWDSLISQTSGMDEQTKAASIFMQPKRERPNHSLDLEARTLNHRWIDDCEIVNSHWYKLKVERVCLLSYW